MFWRPIIAICVINAGVLIVGATISLEKWHPHDLERTGAMLVASSGLFVVWQVNEEIRAERRDARVSKEPDERLQRLPLELLAAKLETLELERQRSRLRIGRLSLVGIIAVWLAFGETLHAFGDLIFEVCTAKFVSLHNDHR